MNKFGFLGISQLVLCTLAVVMASVGTLSFGVFQPQLLVALEASVSALSFAVSIILLMMGLSAPIVGRMLDSAPVRSLMLPGGASLALGLLAASFSSNAYQLLASYFLIGVGASLFSPMVVVKHMSDWFPNNLGLATAIVTLPIGAVIYPQLTQWLIHSFSWRGSYQIYFLAALVVTVLVCFIRSASSATPNIQSSSDPSDARATTDQSVPGRVVYAHLLRSPMFWFVVIGVCVFIAAPVSLMAHLLVLVENKGFENTEGVRLLTVMGFASLVGGPLLGLFSDRFGPRMGYTLLGFLQGVILLLLLDQIDSIQLVVVALVIGAFMSASYVFFVGLLTRLIDQANFGTGMGLGTLISAVVIAVMPTIAGAIYDNRGSFDLYFMILGVLTLAVGLGALLIGEPGEIAYVDKSD